MRLSPSIPAPLLLLSALLAGWGCAGGESPEPRAGSAANAPLERAVSVLEPQFPDDPYEIEIGHLPFGERARRSVHLRNDSAQPLVIRSVRPGCSCATPELSYVDPATGAEVRADARGRGDVITIPAGLAFDMHLEVDSTISPAKNAHKVVVVRMTTDSAVEPYITFNLRVFVECHFLPAPALLDLGRVSQHGGAQGTLTLVADSPDGRRITGIAASPRDVLAGLTERTQSGATLWDLNVQLLPPLTGGPQSWTVELSTSGPHGEGQGTPIQVDLRAVGSPDVAIEPAIVLLDPTPVGEAATSQARLVTRLAGQRLLVRAARVEGDLAGRLEVEAEPLTPDDDGRSAHWTLRLVARAELGASPLSGRLLVETDDAAHALVEARVHYRP